MKKVFSLLMIVIVVATALVFNTRSVSAAPIGVTVYVAALEGKATGAQVFARFWADSDWHAVYCVVTDEPGYITCQFPEKYAGQYLQIGFKVSETYHYFMVTVPTRQPKAPTVTIISTPTCTSPEVLGADVEFTLGQSIAPSTVTYFLAGNTLGDVATTANGWVSNSGGYYTGYQIVSGLKCGQEPS